MRILVSTPTFLPIVGGAEVGIHELYHRLGRSHDVTILASGQPSHVVEHYGVHDYFSDNYRVEYVYPSLDRLLPKLPLRVLKRTSLLYVAEIARIARTSRPDVVNFHFIKPHGSALVFTRRLLGIPTVLSLVGRSDVLKLLPAPKRAYAKAVISASDLLLANSSYYLGSDYEDPRLRIIPYGVDTKEFSPQHRDTELRSELGLTEDDFLLFTVQRLARVKRVDALIRMMAQVTDAAHRVVLAIGGKGEEEANLRELVRKEGLEERVRFIGYIDSERLPIYFASADAFVFHSTFETFGVVFAQAMASGLPIIAAETSSIPHVLSEDNGFLVPAFDSQAFAAAVLRLANDPGLAARVASHNRERAVREFDWDQIAWRYGDELEQLISR